MAAGLCNRTPFLCRAAALITGCVVAVALLAAAPKANLELGQVEITADVSWPLEDYLEVPRFDSVAISPGGTRLATGWLENAGVVNLAGGSLVTNTGPENATPSTAFMSSRVSFTEFPSLKPLGNGNMPMVGLVASDLQWLDERRLVIQPSFPAPGFERLRASLGSLLVMGTDGRIQHHIPRPTSSFVSFWHDAELIAIRDRKGPKDIGPVRTVATRIGEPDQLLMQTLWTGDGWSNASRYGVMKLDLRSGKQVRVATLPLRGGQVITGPDGRVSLVAGLNQQDEQVVYYLPETARTGGRDWRLLVRGDGNGRGLRPLVWTGQGEEYYALDDRGMPRRAVVIWNARDNTRRVLYSHPDADMDKVAMDPSGKPWMFSGMSLIPVYWYPDPAHPLAQLHRTLARQFAPEHVEILNASDDLATAVVRISSGQRPTTFLVVDVRTGKSITGMESYPKLHGRRLSPVDAIEFRARDGLAIRGFLTTPLNDKGDRKRGVPLLVIAHGRPRGTIRDPYAGAPPLPDGSYDFERQLFASRGYAVLEVNVRGTAGRGAAFEQAGDGKWGREVQDDFADAVRWTIREGVANAGHVCFYGTGYGAYSALMTVSRNADLFQCVIGVAGIYDLPVMVHTLMATDVPKEYVPSEMTSPGLAAAAQINRELDDNLAQGGVTSKELQAARREEATRAQSEGIRELSLSQQERARAQATRLRLLKTARARQLEKQGATETIPLFLQRAFGGEMSELQARSPISHAASIKAKALLLHQFMDDRVPEEQLDAMRTALRSAGNPAEVEVIGDNENGNPYYDLQTRVDIYRRMLSFLDQQIGH